jgi:hydrogenase maturation protease
MMGSDVDLVSGSASTAHLEPPAVLIIGVGNLLMGDEGVGIHVINALEEEPALPGVQLLDGGTGGINLLEAIARAPIVVMIDATRDGKRAGTITELEPACVADIPRGLSAHDFGLRDLFAAAALLGQFPDIRLFTVSVETINPMCLELSEPVSEAVPIVVRGVHNLAERLIA